MRKKMSTMYNQKGATLIIVLFVLILVIIVGVTAFKRSTTDLHVATAAQIDKLTFQANNIAFSKVEEISRNSTIGGVTSLQGYITRPGQQYVNAEVVLCLKPKTKKLFDITQISEKNATGSIIAGRNSGFCDVSNSDHYISEGRVVTQLTFKKKQAVVACAFCNEAIGSSSNDLEITTDAQPVCVPFEAHAVSLVPRYSSASDTQINNCLKKTIDGSDSIGVCLTKLGVPHNIQTQTYRDEPVGMKCLS